MSKQLSSHCLNLAVSSCDPLLDLRVDVPFRIHWHPDDDICGDISQAGPIGSVKPVDISVGLQGVVDILGEYAVLDHIQRHSGPWG